jgi:hypothetical protein
MAWILKSADRMRSFKRSLLDPTDSRLAAMISIIGFAGVGVGMATHADPFAVPPSIDGIMASALLGFVLATLHGLGFRRSLAMMLPALAILGGAAQRSHESPFALVGINLVLFGALGFAVAIFAHERRAHAAAPGWR